MEPYRQHRNNHKKIWKAKIRLFTLALSNLFLSIAFFPNEWQRIKKFSKTSVTPTLITSKTNPRPQESFKQLKEMLKACVCYFLTNFYLSPNDSPSKAMKDAFYFILKALFILKIFIFLYFHLPLFFSLSAIALELDPR